MRSHGHRLAKLEQRAARIGGGVPLRDLIAAAWQCECDALGVPGHYPPAITEWETLAARHQSALLSRRSTLEAPAS